MYPTQSSMKSLQNGHLPNNTNDSNITNTASSPLTTDQPKVQTSTPRRERKDAESTVGEKPVLQPFPIIPSATVPGEHEQQQQSSHQANVHNKVTKQMNHLSMNGRYSPVHSAPSSFDDDDDDDDSHDHHNHDHHNDHDHDDIILNVDKSQHSESAEHRPSSSSQLGYPERVQLIASAVRTILHCLDDDSSRSGLKKTPERYAKALLALTDGYSQTPEQIANNARFKETPSESVMVRNIDVFSLCEHHLLPFHGICHVAYIPNTHVVGLSKVARIVNMYARRLQVQERLTAQIADAISQVTHAHGVMVLMTCTHMCMSMRGVQKVSAETSTTATRGRYSKDPDLRSEFLATVKH